MVEQRYLAVREALDSGATITDIARRYGVDRRTVHRWLLRYARGGLAALADRSPKPDRCPHQTSPELEARIVALRRANPGWGPRTILVKLRRELEQPPSRSAIYRCLLRHRLIAPQPRRRRREDYKRWERSRPMERCGSSWGRGAERVAGLSEGSPETRIPPGQFHPCIAGERMAPFAPGGSMDGPFKSTHVVPERGTRAWTEPDPTADPVTRLKPRVKLRILEWRGAWALVEGSNGWTGWVDGRTLVPLETGPQVTAPTPSSLPQAPAAPAAYPPGPKRPDRITVSSRPVPLIAVAVILMGSFLPLISFAGGGGTSWDVPLLALLDNSPDAEGFKTAFLLLGVILLLAPYLSGRAFPFGVVLLLAGLASNVASFTMFRSTVDASSPGVGALVILLGGLLLAVEEAVYRIRLRMAKAGRQ